MWIIPLFAIANLVILGFRFFRTGTTVMEGGVSALLILAAVYAMVASVAVVNRHWSSRRIFFASELCRPSSRREYVDDIFLISRSNLARPVLAVCSVQAALALVSYSSWLHAASAGMGLAIFLIGFAMICYATGMWSITLEKDWMLSLVAIGMLFGGVAVLMAVASLSGILGSKSFVAHPIALAIIGFALLLIGYAVLNYARSCWTRIEFAKLVR